MKLAFISDVHVGNPRRLGGASVAGINQRGRMVLDTLERAVAEVRKRGVDFLVVCGDLFDSARPEPQLIAEVQRIFQPLSNPRRVILLAGNHDRVSAARGDHALGPLAPMAHVVDEPRVFKWIGGGGALRLLCMPFSAKPPREWLASTITTLQSEAGYAAGVSTTDVGAVHFGVSDSNTEVWLRDSQDAGSAEEVMEVMRRTGVKHLFAGNWHNSCRWRSTGPGSGEVEIVQLGALVPTGWDNPSTWRTGFSNSDDYGGLVVYDARTGESERVSVSGPRFLLIPYSLFLETASVLDGLLGQPNLFVRVSAEPSQMAAATELASRFGGRAEVVVRDSAWELVAAREAAQEAGASATLDEALAGFVGAMTKPEGVTSPEVLAEARKYLMRL